MAPAPDTPRPDGPRQAADGVTGDGPTGDAAQRHLGQVARGGAVGLAGAAVSAVSGFVLVVVVARLYEKDAAGVFFAVSSLFLVLGAVAGLGADTGLGRFMLRFEALGRRGDIPAALQAAFRPPLVLAVVLAIGLFALADPVADLLGADVVGGAGAVRVLAVCLPFLVLHQLALAGTRAFGRMKATALVDGVLRSGSQPLLAVLVSMLGTGLVALTLSWAVPYVLACGVSVLLFRRFLRRRGPFPEGGDPAAVRREFWRFTWPRSITKIAQMVIQRADIVIIAALRSPAEAAVYTAATRFVALGQIGTQAIQQVVQPKFTSLLAEKDPALGEIYRTSTAWSMAISWPIYVVVGCAPMAYLGLFGGSYAEDGTPVVVLMMVAMLFGIASGPADVLLLMSGRSMLSLINALVALALDLVLCFLLIPEYGITGAAVAWAVAVVTRVSLALFQVRRILAIAFLSRGAAVVAAACVVTLAIPLLLLGLVVDVDLPVLAAALVVLIPAYLGVLWWQREPLRLTVLRTLVRRKAGREVTP